MGCGPSVETEHKKLVAKRTRGRSTVDTSRSSPGSLDRTLDRPPRRRTPTPNKKKENRGGKKTAISSKKGSGVAGSRQSSSGHRPPMSPTSELARREREDEELKAIQHEATRHKDVGKVRFGFQSSRDISNWVQESALKKKEGGDSRRGSKTGRKLSFQLDDS